jgi:hypothetical protein
MKKLLLLFAGLFLALSSNLMAADVVVDPAVTPKLTDAYAAAASGDVLILMDGTYVVDANISMTKAITIKAQNPKKATISGATFQFVTNSAGNVTIKDLVLDGTKAIVPPATTATLAGYVVDFAPAANGLIVNNVLFENCNVSNYGNCFLRANRYEGTCESFKVNNCIIKSNGTVAAYPFFQVAKTKFGTGSLELTNSTIADFSNEYIQSYGTTAGADNTATYLFKNNTFYNTVTVAARKPFLFNSGTVYVQNNIFVKTTTTARTVDVTINLAVTTAEFTNNVVNNYDAGALLNSPLVVAGTTGGWSVSSGNQDVDPGFKDVTAYDFTLPTGSALIAAKIGDPRWFGVSAAVNSPKVSSTLISTSGKEILLSEVQDVNIYNVTGELLKSAKQVNQLSVANLKKGVYIVKAGTAVQKFVNK